MTIRSKLRAWFLLLAAVMVGLLAASFWASKTLESDLDHMIDSSLAEAAAVNEIIGTLTDIEVYVLKASPDAGEEISSTQRAANRVALAQFAKRYETSLDQAYQASLLGAKMAHAADGYDHEVKVAEEVARLKQRFGVFIQQVGGLPAFRVDGVFDGPAKSTEEVLGILQDELEPQMLRYMTSSLEEQKAVGAATKSTSVFARRVFVGSAMGTVVLIFFGLMVMTRAVAGPLTRFVAAAGKISAGDHDLRLRYDRRDEFGDLARVLDTMLDSLRDSSVSRNELETVVRLRTAELQASRENLQITLDSIGDGVMVTDAHARVTRLNPVAELMTGWSEKDAIGRPVDEIFRIVHEGHRTPMTIPVGAVLATGIAKELENHTLLLSRNGREWPVADSCAPIHDADQRVIGSVLVFRDVTDERAARNTILEANASLERLIAERTGALQESERRHRTLIGNLQGMVYRYGVGGGEWKPEFVSDGCRAILGLAPEELIGSSVVFKALIHPDDIAAARQTVVAGLQSGQSFAVEYRARHADGDWRWISGQGRGVRNAAGQLEAFEGYMGDVTEQKLTENALRLLSTELANAGGDEFFQSVAARVADLLGAEIGFVGKVVSEQPPLIRMVGLSVDGKGEPLFDFDPTRTPCENISERTMDIIPDGLEQRFSDNARIVDWRVVGYAGLPLCNASGRAIGRLGVMSRKPLRHTERVGSLLRLFSVRVVAEIERLEAEEERHRLEAQLRQSQKMEAIGTLAGGIAHDFNNVLGGIMGYTELLKPEMATPDQKDYLHMIEASTGRARDLVKQILTFSRRTEAQRVPLRLQGLVEEVIKLLHSTLPAMVQLRCRIAASPLILADPTQIHQVLLNLCTNAWQALPERGGCIDVTVNTCSVSEEMARIHSEIKPGVYALLQVADNGCGMDSATHARIFDPFFTTKPAGKGTGLGLAVVHGIMQLHQGAIVVQSTPGQGSTFDLYFPLAEVKPRPPEIQTVAVPALKAVAGQHILLVDDELIIGMSTERLLKRAGYCVTMTESAEEALATVQASPGGIDLLITDLAMPGMTGLELVGRIREINPELPVMLMTGYLDPDLRAKVAELKIDEVLRKPVSSARMDAAVAKILARASEAKAKK